MCAKIQMRYTGKCRKGELSFRETKKGVETELRGNELGICGEK